MSSDFIEIYAHAVAEGDCQALIRHFEASGKAVRGKTGGGVNTRLKDSWDICIDDHAEWAGAVNMLNSVMMRCLIPYVRKYPHLIIAPLFLKVPDADGNESTREVLKLHPALAPVKVAVLPLLKNKEELTQAAGDVFNPPQYKPEKVGNDASARPWEQFGQAAPMAGAAAGGSMIGAALSGAQTWGIPADFDTEGFITAAKRNYLSLQAAWDAGDLATLRSMMTDEMLSEVRQQLAEREAEAEGAANINEIEGLEAQLLGIEDQGDVYLASVEFSGMSREEQGAGLSPFREVWNMAKPKSGNGGWLVAGLQALT